MSLLRWGCLLLICAGPASAATCTLETIKGRWGVQTAESSFTPHGQGGTYTYSLNVNFRADGTLRGILSLNRWAYPYSYNKAVSGGYRLSSTCTLHAWWTDSVGFRYSMRGLVASDGSLLRAVGVSNQVSFAINGERI